MHETPQQLKSLPPPLLAWYDANRRRLPWREEVSPYRTWVSEIMLQQTRVAAVLPYFARFMDALPTVAALAAADERQLMALWQGLGYYSRARNLQKAARIITGEHGGVFPDTYEALVRGGHVRDIPCLIGCTRNDITVGDDLYSSPIYTGCVEWALATEQAGHTPSYVYVFDRAPLGGEGQGAFHSCDLWYSFHTLGRSWREKEPVDYQIADEMNRRWADFIRTGSPNDETLPPWSPFTEANPEVKHFG